MTDLPFDYSDVEERNLGAPRPRPCTRHRWVVTLDGIVCARCGKPHDPVKSRQGKRSRRRGNDYERELATMLGGRRTGMYGGPDDVMVTGLFSIQSKVGLRFPGWLWDELAKLPRTDGLIPLVVVADSPGPGRRRRAIVVVTLPDWVDLHGPLTRETE